MWVKMCGKVFMVLALGFFVIPLQADSRIPTAAEAAMLPPYCQVKLAHSMGKGFDQNAHKLWAQRLGSSWKNLHHYCWGLNFINKAKLSFDQEHRRYVLNQASSELRYIINHWSKSPDNSPLLMEAKLHLQEVELMQKMLKKR